MSKLNTLTHIKKTTKDAFEKALIEGLSSLSCESLDLEITPTNFDKLDGVNNRSRKFLKKKKLLRSERLLCRKTKLQSLDFISLVNRYVNEYEVLGDIFDFVEDRCFDPNWILKLIEDILVLVKMLITRKTKKDFAFAILIFVKLRCGDSSLVSGMYNKLYDYFTKIFDYSVQSTDVFGVIRQGIGKFEEIKNCSLFAKLYKVLMYAMSLSVFSKIGLTFSTLGYTMIESEAFKRKYHLGVDFFYTIAETLLFICERGYQCIKTGNLDSLLHSGKSYDDFYDKLVLLQRQSSAMGNPALMELEKCTESSFFADLDEMIEKADSIYKHAKALNSSDKKIVGDMRNRLYMMKAEHYTIKAALQDRKAPFSILVFGNSGIGKTTLINVLFTHYGKKCGLRVGDEFKYTKNPVSKYWDNFRTSMWCVVADDIGFMKTNIAMGGGDPTCMEELQINNAVPFTPDQASLDQKGKMPLKCELVIGTTNSKHMNSHAYFSCPSAFQRRFPYVITVKVVPEYSTDGMLDSSKVPNMDQDDYPDLWFFKVEKILPKPVVDVDFVGLADSELVLEGARIKEFIQWYNKAIEQHKKNQIITGDSNKQIKEVTLCLGCSLPLAMCDCSNVIQSKAESIFAILLAPFLVFTFSVMYLNVTASMLYKAKIVLKAKGLWPVIGPIAKFIKYSWRFTLGVGYIPFAYFKYVVPERTHSWLATTLPRPVINTYTKWKCWYNLKKYRFVQDHYRTYWFTLGCRIKDTIGYPVILSMIVLSITSAVTLYKSGKVILDLNSEDKEEEEIPTKEAKDFRKPVAQDEKPNVWYKDEFQLSQFEMTNKMSGFNSLSSNDVIKKIQNNCLVFSVMSENKCIRHTKVLGVKGQIYILNQHFLPLLDSFNITITQQPLSTGISRNRIVHFERSQFISVPNTDLVFVKISNLPPVADISELFAKSSFAGRFNGLYVQRDLQGDPKTIVLNNIVKTSLYIDEFKRYEPVWGATPLTPTINGDCGSVMLIFTPKGPMILGLHTVYAEASNNSYAIMTTNEVINTMCKQLEPQSVQCGTPMLSAPSIKRTLGPLHAKSTIRYIEHGSATVYGSFQEFRGTHKSSVEETPLALPLEKFNYKVKYGRPVMSGWVPWRHAMRDLTQPIFLMKESILDQCKKSFLKDILANIDPVEMRSEVHKYDVFTSVNGAAGVAFVDKMNRNTSMGNPWKKSKKFFISPIPALGKNLDPVEFSPEIMDRVFEMERIYKTGHRNHPNFCGQLKDEARSFKKIEEGKTRVFTAAPGDATVLGRMYLLSTVRFLQKNTFAFEAAPGVICQSLEWTQFYKYLTAHGRDRMVAGDFANYDKNMAASLILSAFWILSQICEKSGNYTDEDLLVIAGIAQDTAFPLVDFNGDLVEFMGSNPSGHFLTVVINSLANSLYMRYCYSVLSPEKNCEMFKDHVSLMTYGDDNIMGVSRNAPFFNHTSIQAALKDIGVTYTMAEKTAASIPYINITECSFLKRSWRWDSDVGAWLCPLDHDSIEKMLTVWVRSKSISKEVQCMAIISSAVSEYFFYGREVFEKRRAILQNVVRELDMELWITASVFPTWEELAIRFDKADRR